MALAFPIATVLLLLPFIVIDIKYRIVPDSLLVIAVPLAILIGMFGQGLSMASELVGAGVGAILMFGIALAGNGGVGWGDVKLAPVLGIMVGWPSVLVVLGSSLLFGAITATVVLMWHDRQPRQQSIPFVPAMAAGTAVGLVWGNDITRGVTQAFQQYFLRGS